MTYDIPSMRQRNRIIMLIEDIDCSLISALHFVISISDDITVFSVAYDDESRERLIRSWKKIDTCVPFVLHDLKEDGIVNALMKFISSDEFHRERDDIITVVLPRLAAQNRWQRILSNSTSRFIERQLVKHKDVAVIVLPYRLANLKIESIQDGLSSLEGGF